MKARTRIAIFLAGLAVGAATVAPVDFSLPAPVPVQGHETGARAAPGDAAAAAPPDRSWHSGRFGFPGAGLPKAVTITPAIGEPP